MKKWQKTRKEEKDKTVTTTVVEDIVPPIIIDNMLVKAFLYYNIDFIYLPESKDLPYSLLPVPKSTFHNIAINEVPINTVTKVTKETKEKLIKFNSGFEDKIVSQKKRIKSFSDFGYRIEGDDKGIEKYLIDEVVNELLIYTDGSIIRYENFANFKQSKEKEENINKLTGKGGTINSEFSKLSKEAFKLYNIIITQINVIPLSDREKLLEDSKSLNWVNWMYGFFLESLSGEGELYKEILFYMDSNFQLAKAANLVENPPLLTRNKDFIQAGIDMGRDLASHKLLLAGYISKLITLMTAFTNFLNDIKTADTEELYLTQSETIKKVTAVYIPGISSPKISSDDWKIFITTIIKKVNENTNSKPEWNLKAKEVSSKLKLTKNKISTLNVIALAVKINKQEGKKYQDIYNNNLKNMAKDKFLKYD